MTSACFFLQAYGVIIGRNYLGRGRGGAEHHAFVHARVFFADQQMVYGTVAGAGDGVEVVEVIDGLVGDLGMKGVGMDVDEHGRPCEM